MTKYAILVLSLLSVSVGVPAQDSYQDRKEALQAAKHIYEMAEDDKTAEDAEVAQATFDYGFALLRAMDAKESRKLLKLALKRYRNVYGKDSPRQISTLLYLAQSEFMLRRSRPSQRYL